MSYMFPPHGANYTENNRCTFSVWAPLKKKIELVIDSPQQNIFLMDRDGSGMWSVTLDNIEPYTRYFFRIDENKVLPDPASKFQPEGVHGPSAVINQGFSWSDSDWKGIALKDMIIYELHVGTFTKQQNLDGVISKLSYLKELGINSIELMPLAQFPGNRNWGYDGVFPFATQNSYGGPEGLKTLVNEAHKNGIAVILDVVYNHQGPEGNYFVEFAPYFSSRYKTFWGSAINFDDAYCDGVRSFYWQNALMWLDEFHIDGLRLDAVHAIWDFGANHFIEELMQNVSDVEERTGCEKVVIAEFDLNNPRYINPPTKGGYGMDGQWIDEFHHALHALITGEVDGYYEDFGEVRHLANAIRDSYVYTGQYSVHRKKKFGRLPQENPYSQFIVFAQNHDQVGNRIMGDRLSNHLSLEALKLAASTVILSPQVPMLFMGEEYGEKNPFLYFISHGDRDLVKSVREGRRKEFSHFNWKGDVPDPQSEETFSRCILSWSKDNDPQQRHLFAYYQYLISFRKTRTAMKGHEKQNVKVFYAENSRVICFERSHKGDNILVALNFDKEVAPFIAPGSNSFRKICDSASLDWRGPGELAPPLFMSGDQIFLQPESAIICEF
jgi:maltooligosyltrehalose trehalohydrolase